MSRSDDLDDALGVYCTAINAGEKVDIEAAEKDLLDRFGDLPEIDDALNVLANAAEDA